METVAKTKAWAVKYRKVILITTSVIVLNVVFGFDPKFTIINIVWLFV